MKRTFWLSLASLALIAACSWPPGGLPSVPDVPVDQAAAQAAGTVDQAAGTVDQAAGTAVETVGQTTSTVTRSVPRMAAPRMSAPRLGGMGGVGGGRGGLLRR
jgi:hypothetical protein